MISVVNMLRMQSYGICISMLLVVLIKMIIEKDNDNLQNKLFTATICFSLSILVVEAAGWVFDGEAGMYARITVIACNSLQQVLIFVPAALWAMYADYLVYSSNNRIKNIAIISGIVLIYFTFLSVSAQFNHLLFYIDSANRYHRGAWYWQSQCMVYVFLLYVVVILILNRNELARSVFIPMLLFPVMPVAGILLQMIFYGLSTAWSGVSISILILYIYIQSQKSSKDYLTGLYNRRQLDLYLKNNINGRSPSKILSVIMIDINRFKEINDTWGHEMGDSALKYCADILKKCFHYRDFIARYAGDEFVVVLELNNSNDIHNVVERLRDTVANMKNDEKVPYRLSLSIGYALFPDEGNDAARILQLADERMYIEKNKIISTR